jgi:hypothetical protein
MPMPPNITSNSSKEISDKGAEIYERLYRGEYESKWAGRFAAIDVDSEGAFVADFPEQALAAARSANPGHLFYLLRIGSRGAFRISRRLSDAFNRQV